MHDSNTLRIYTGLPGTGKTSQLIDEMGSQADAGGKVVLLLSNEHSHLTARANVQPGRLMGCRIPNKGFKIDHVCSTDEAIAELSALEEGSLAVFDEAQYFRVDISDAWIQAAERGVQVRVASPSKGQLQALKGARYTLQEFETDCVCGERKATHAWNEDSEKFPTHLCDPCYEKNYKAAIDALLSDTREAEPFPGELRTYQPFYGIDMHDWSLVRADSPERLDIIIQAVARARLTDTTRQPSYLDLGCCSGFFCDGMNGLGFSATGVDVTPHFIEWGTRLAKIKEQTIDFQKMDAYEFLRESTAEFDVTSTFATVQWVMAQKGYDKGVECFKMLFDKTRHIAIVEMGYTSEDIYREKITDRPREIDAEWVMDIMQEHGNFDTIEVHAANENGIWRDIFVGFKQQSGVTPVVSRPSILRLKILLKARMPRLFEQLRKLKRWIKSIAG